MCAQLRTTCYNRPLAQFMRDTPSNPAWCVQVCNFLKLDPSPAREMMYACAVRCSHTKQLERGGPREGPHKRQCKSMPVTRIKERCSAHACQVLCSQPDIADAVFTAPCAHCDVAPVSLALLYDTLRAELHATAARGFFGAEATVWPLDCCDDAVCPASERTAQLLAQQPRVTAVHVSCAAAAEQVVRLLSNVARANHLSAVAFYDLHVRDAPTVWLQCLAPLSSLQRLEMWECHLQSAELPDLVRALAHFSQLSTLVLWGDITYRGHDDAHMATFASGLAALPALAQLGLSGFEIAYEGASALGALLPSMTRLRALDLSCTAAMGYSDAVAEGIAACSALDELDVSRCNICEVLSGTLSTLCSMRAQLHGLSLDGNDAMRSAGLKQLLAAPALAALTRLGLSDGCIDTREVDGRSEWPWRQLCGLTALRHLSLQLNDLCDDGANSLAQHIGALAQLEALNIADCMISCAGVLSREVVKLPRLKRLACEQGNCAGSEPFVAPAEAVKRGIEVVGLWDMR